jgi:hypothetical protein
VTGFVDLSREERGRIYEEEKARYQARKDLEREDKKGDHIVARVLFFGGTAIVWFMLMKLFRVF